MTASFDPHAQMWAHASRDHEAEASERTYLVAKVAAQEVAWPFLAAAASPTEYDARAELVTDRIEAAVQKVSEDPGVLVQVQASLKEDFAVLQAQQLTTAQNRVASLRQVAAAWAVPDGALATFARTGRVLATAEREVRQLLGFLGNLSDSDAAEIKALAQYIGSARGRFLAEAAVPAMPLPRPVKKMPKPEDVVDEQAEGEDIPEFGNKKKSAVIEDEDPYFDLDDEVHRDRGEDYATGMYPDEPQPEQTIHDRPAPTMEQMAREVQERNRRLNRGASMLKGAPFAGYDDFAACVAANQDKDDPEAYCGKIKHQVEDGQKTSASVRADQSALQDYMSNPTIDHGTNLLQNWMNLTQYAKPMDHATYTDDPTEFGVYTPGGQMPEGQQHWEQWKTQHPEEHRQHYSLSTRLAWEAQPGNLAWKAPVGERIHAEILDSTPFGRGYEWYIHDHNQPGGQGIVGSGNSASLEAAQNSIEQTLGTPRQALKQADMAGVIGDAPPQQEDLGVPGAEDPHFLLGTDPKGYSVTFAESGLVMRPATRNDMTRLREGQTQFRDPVTNQLVQITRTAVHGTMINGVFHPDEEGSARYEDKISAPAQPDWIHDSWLEAPATPIGDTDAENNADGDELKATAPWLVQREAVSMDQLMSNNPYAPTGMDPTSGLPGRPYPTYQTQMGEAAYPNIASPVQPLDEVDAPSGGGSEVPEPDQDLTAPEQPRPMTSSVYAQPVHDPVDRIAASVLAANPAVTPTMALAIARRTLERHPEMAGV